ncbi:MAG: alpha-glucosidase/alpha-galactosidase [Candidatus Latescibacterota bacterium]|nr:alpha-glucosidase/alpha-galactosidase [Candidatus Latescibacterota bacterium]
MPKPVRISVIGAGSATFSLGLVKDLCLTENLSGSHVTFMDIDADRLHDVTRMAERFTSEIGSNLSFGQTTSREDSLKEADFVINTAAAQSHYHQVDMRTVYARHGYYYRGPGFGSYYNFNLMLDVVRDMERVCPDAWLIQSGNPVFDGCTLMTRETDIKVCGLCHGHYGYHHIARTLGLDRERIAFQAPGVNHCIWMTHFLYDGEDAYPLIDKWIEEEGEAYWESHIASGTHDIQLSRGAVHQYRLYGLFPIGDSPRLGNWWYHSDIDTKKWWFGEPYGGPDTHIARPVHVEKLEARLNQIREASQAPKANMTELIGTTKTREQQVPIIDALTNNVEGQFQVNVPNNGTIDGIDDDVVVEVPAIINQEGIQPTQVGKLPKKIMLEQLLPTVLKMEHGLEAYKTGDKSMLLWSALNDGQTQSYKQAYAALEDILRQKGNEAASEHFQYPWPDGHESVYLNE